MEEAEINDKLRQKDTISLKQGKYPFGNENTRREITKAILGHTGVE